MILVDTSVWIDFFGGSDTKQSIELEALIENEEDIAICGINLTEILQGIADEMTFRRVHRQISGIILLPLIEKTFLDAATLYRTLRSKGVTIRKTNDCIIAASAMEHPVAYCTTTAISLQSVGTFPCASTGD